jgi:cholesterol oxidase
MTTNPASTPGRLLRKMLPPRSFAAPPIVESDGKLTFRVSFDQRNGVPTSAVLMPVVVHQGQWQILKEGQPVDLRDIRRIGADAVMADVLAEGATVTATLSWPTGTDRAVLLLIHPQTKVEVEIASDQDFDEIVDHKEAISLESGVITRRKSDTDVSETNAAFAVSSCQYPAGMLDGSVRVRSRALDDRYIGPAERSLWRLGERLENDESIRFTVLTGDQVYVDRTAGLFDPSKLLERLAFAYEAFMLNAGLQRVLRVAGAEIFPMLDDHEVSDNWEPRPRGFGHDEIQDEIKQSRQAYVARQRSMWPKSARESLSKGPSDQLWVKTQVHGYPFFFADARTQRTGRTIETLKDATILGTGQSSNLRAWIETQRASDRPSFVVSSSILLPRYLSMQKCGVTSACHAVALQMDSWAGYPKSLHDLLAWVYDAEAHRIVFLSGDEHLSCLATITIERLDVPGKCVTVHSIHSSALYAPYAFANSKVEDFASPDCFEFEQDAEGGKRRRFRCRVETFFPRTGDGFAIVRPCPTGASSWRLDVDFDGADGQVRRTVQL